MSETAEVVGAKAVCAMCKKPITFVGPYWDHDGEPKPRHPATPTPWVTADFEKELAALLNRHNWDGRTKTPDFILAFFLVGILERFDTTMYRRNLWFTKPAGPDEKAKLGDKVRIIECENGGA